MWSFLLINILSTGSVWQTSAECRPDREGRSVSDGQGARVLSPSREWESVTVYLFNTPPQVSHYLGMDVHDCGRADKKRPLEPGMVITVEPGLYIPHTQANVDRDWWGTAVRWVNVWPLIGPL